MYAYGWLLFSCITTRKDAVIGTQVTAPSTPHKFPQKHSARRTTTGCKLKKDANIRGSRMLPKKLFMSTGQKKQMTKST